MHRHLLLNKILMRRLQLRQGVSVHCTDAVNPVFKFQEHVGV